MHPPKFWQHDTASLLPTLLAPASALVARATARRLARPGWRAPIPVICCGNVTIGGAGKTTLALNLAARLQAQGTTIHFLTRGHGGQSRGPLKINPAVHDAKTVGDEPLLLAAQAPTWLGTNRAETARLAIQAGAQTLIMDDGLQNPTLAQTLPFLVIDGATGFGNARTLPAGPLREPITTAANRVRAAILIGPDATGALNHLPPTLPILRAHLQPPNLSYLTQPLLAFAGIARPSKFFNMLAGLNLAATRPFPDHHRFRPAELAALHTDAARLGARLVTTPKDFVRIPPEDRAGIIAIGVSLVWEDEGALDALLEASKEGLLF